MIARIVAGAAQDRPSSLVDSWIKLGLLLMIVGLGVGLTAMFISHGQFPVAIPALGVLGTLLIYVTLRTTRRRER